MSIAGAKLQMSFSSRFWIQFTGTLWCLKVMLTWINEHNKHIGLVNLDTIIPIVTGVEVTIGNCFPDVWEILPDAKGGG